MRFCNKSSCSNLSSTNGDCERTLPRWQMRFPSCTSGLAGSSYVMAPVLISISAIWPDVSGRKYLPSLM